MYLDFGTNIGIQIRKLYEPYLFPKAPVIQIFQEVFGNKTNKYNICAVGFEPNEASKNHLNALEKSYREVGFPLTIFTDTAIYNEEKFLTFYRDVGAADQDHEWGSSLFRWNTAMVKNGYEVLGINTCNFMHTLLQKWRSVNYKEGVSSMLVKMDIEGAEFKVLPHLIFGGCLCYVNAMFIDWHSRMVEPGTGVDEIKNLLHSIEKYSMMSNKSACHFRIVDVDDETYNDAKFPLPHKKNTSARTIMRRIFSS